MRAASSLACRSASVGFGGFGRLDEATAGQITGPLARLAATLRGLLTAALLFSPFEFFLNHLHKFLIVLVLQNLKKLGV
jgi:hypothetical protein